MTTGDDPPPDWFDQSPHRLRFGWGPNGMRRLAPVVDVVVIVDVLSFSTSVDIALGRGAAVLPYRWHDGTEHEYAAKNGALVAVKAPRPTDVVSDPVSGGSAADPEDPRPHRLSLRPSSLLGAEPGIRLVLPSPNGSALAFAASEAGASAVLVGCLRNRRAVAAVAAGIAARSATDAGPGAGSIAVIGAGERWRGTTGPLRPAIEDLIGAGAILAALADRSSPPIGSPPVDHASVDRALVDHAPVDRALVDAGPDVGTFAGPTGSSPAAAGPSPEALVAVAAFRDAEAALPARIADCGSGRELVGRGFGRDVELAAELDASPVAPVLDGPQLVDGAAR